MVNRLTLFLLTLLLLGCTSEPKYPAPPAVLGTAAMVSDASAKALQKRPVDWVIARRWTLGPGFAPVVEANAAPLAITRAFHAGPVLGLVRCDEACIGAMKKALPDGAERAHLEQRILRSTEDERVDGLMLDLSGLDEVDSATSAFIEELGAVLHTSDRKVGLLMRMTCRDVVCTGVRLLGRVARSADLVILDETNADFVEDGARSDRRRRAVKEAFPNKGPTARVFLNGIEDPDRKTEDARALGFGGIYIGDLDLSTSSREAP